MADYQHNDYASEFRQRSRGYWDAVSAYVRGNGPPPCRPYQVEVHPALLGSPICLQRCVDCHGQFHREYGSLARQHYDRLIDNLIEMRVPSVVLSGTYSDPSTNADLLCHFLQEGGPHWGVKLHTYGLGLTPAVRQAIVAAALASPTSGSYVTISKCTHDLLTYVDLCRPVWGMNPGIKAEEGNIISLCELAAECNTPLTIRLNCRVTRINGNATQLTHLLQWMQCLPNTVGIRFTTDYMPSSAPETYRKWFLTHVYVDAAEAERAIKAATKASHIDPSRVSLRDVEASSYDGSLCYNGLLFASVAATGKIFPCQGISFRQYDHLAYGDLRTESFSLAWLRYVAAWPHMADGCPRCAASCERMINDAFLHEQDH
jgi:hypothetical protein